MELVDRFYSAPEVANILGVTLRSLYRYIRSGKIETFKTAGGRLRFTREAVYNFMGPEIRKTENRAQKTDVVETQHVASPAMSKPRVWGPPITPARPIRKQETAPVKKPSVTTTSLYDEEEEDVKEEIMTPKVAVTEAKKLYYYSNIRDLRLLAQKIQKSCQNAHVPYALTGYAGMSLHKEMPPFSLIQVYVQLDDLPFFENILQCHEVTTEDEANLCFIEVTDLDFWQQTETFKGFKVTVPAKLEADLAEL